MDSFVCPKCYMTFRSSHFLVKHKERFCIGDADQTDVSGSPRNPTLQRGNTHMAWPLGSRNLPVYQFINMSATLSMPTIPCQCLLNSYTSTTFCFELLFRWQNTARSTSKSDRIRELQRRRQQERPRGGAQLIQQNFHTTQHQLKKPDSEPMRPTDDRSDQQIQDLSESHKLQETLSKGSKQLNKQEREINLQDLTSQSKKVAQLEKMLFDLHEQEQRNSALLESLVEHLEHKPVEPPSVSYKGQDIPQSRNTHLCMPETRERVIQTIIPVYGGGPLSTEISTLRLSYLQNGGKDPQILAQLQDLLNEALKVEMKPGKPPQAKTYRTERTKHGPRPKDSRTDLSKELISTELENQHLEEELMRLQLRKRRSALSRTATNCQPSEQEMRNMKIDLELLKHEAEINRLRSLIRGRKIEPTLSTFPPLEEPRSQTPPLIRNFRGVSGGLGPAPYDPTAGFVVFYDFLLGLCPSYRVCRLMVGLYSGEQPLGSPSVLPPVHCGPFSSPTLPLQYSQRQQAVLASKQAVPEVQPAPSVSLVMQLQASGGYDVYGQEVTHLAPRGWVKLDIFDHHNRIISGRWKILVRSLPAKPSMTAAEVNAVPQLDNAELFLRIVNARDAEIQSSVPISIYTAGIYRYPPVTTLRHHFTRHDSHEPTQTPAVQSSQIYAVPFTQSLDAAATGETLFDIPERPT